MDDQGSAKYYCSLHNEYFLEYHIMKGLSLEFSEEPSPSFACVQTEVVNTIRVSMFFNAQTFLYSFFTKSF